MILLYLRSYVEGERRYGSIQICAAQLLTKNVFSSSEGGKVAVSVFRLIYVGLRSRPSTNVNRNRRWIAGHQCRTTFFLIFTPRQ